MDDSLLEKLMNKSITNPEKKCQEITKAKNKRKPTVYQLLKK